MPIFDRLCLVNVCKAKGRGDVAKMAGGVGELWWDERTGDASTRETWQH
jgi:hypothetical protein